MNFSSHDEYVTNLPAVDCYRTVVDFFGYSQWWPKRFRVKAVRKQEEAKGIHRSHPPGAFLDDPVGSRIYFVPAPLLWVGWEITHVIPEKQIDIRYCRGWHQGTGIWRFEPQPIQTNYSFSIDIVPNNWLFRIIYQIVNVEKKHSQDMHTLFNCMDQFLKHR
jgi:hypothetical protein